METTYIVKKAKLVDRLFLEVELEKIVKIQEGEEINTTVNEVIEKCRQQVHPDLIAAFDALIPHLPQLCELDVHMNLLDPSDFLLSSFKVTGFSIGGNDEHEGVTLIGRKNLKTGKVLNLVAPFTKWEDEHEPYRFAGALYDAIAKCDYEIQQYLFHSKVAPPVQLELNLTTEGVEETKKEEVK